MNISVFQFNSCNDYLRAVLSIKKTSQQSFSLRSFARNLGFSSPSLISSVLNGKRPLNFDLAERVMNYVQASEEEKEYFHVLAMIGNAKQDSEREILYKLASRIKPTKNFQTFELNRFEMMSDWYHIAIYTTFSLKDAPQSVEEIQNLFSNQLRKEIIENALEKLLKAELIVKSGKFYKSTHQLFWVGDSIPSEALRKFHSQMIDRAKLALQNMSMDERDVRGSTLAIKKSDFPKLQKHVQNFFKELHTDFSSKNADVVMQVNTQIFPLSQSKKVDL